MGSTLGRRMGSREGFCLVWSGLTCLLGLSLIALLFSSRHESTGFSFIATRCGFCLILFLAAFV